MSGPLVLDRGSFGNRIPSSVNRLDPQGSRWLPKRMQGLETRSRGDGKNLFGTVHTQEAENRKNGNRTANVQQ